MSKQDKKDLVKTWIIGSIAAFFTLALMGYMNDQDAKLLAKKQVKLTVYASAEGI